MKKKSSIILLMICSLFLITGCNSSKNKVESNGKAVNTNKMQHKHCTRAGNAGSGIEVSLQYDVYYTNDVINILKSEEKVITTKQDSLDTYQEAYLGIHEHYKSLKYYDTNVDRGEDYVASTITINYDKVDIDELIAIEGEEDNIFENKIPKLDKWMELAKKFGTKCEEVDN